MLTKLVIKTAILSSVLLFSISPVQAGELVDKVSDLMLGHERIKAAQADLAAAQANKSVTEGAYYPTLGLTANLAHEDIYTENPTSTSTETRLPAREVDLSLSQTVWDFGATGATVDGAGLAISQAHAALDIAKQGLLLEALSAQLNVGSAKRVLDFQTNSENSIMKQTELEDARVKRGSGFSTDVLQAKTQLAGAQAARVRAQGGLAQAINRYRAVFGDVPGNITALEEPKILASLLPNDEATVVTAALNDNPQVITAALAADIADTEVARTFSSNFLPVITAKAEQKYKRDVSGTVGYKTERVLKVELIYSFNTGFTAQNTLKASKAGYSAANSRLKDTRDQIEEQARNAWQNLQTTTENAELLTNQANIAGEFLELARKEQTLGQRTLIEVLSGETGLINAQAAADRAVTDANIAKITVLNVMGQLNISVLQ